MTNNQPIKLLLPQVENWGMTRAGYCQCADTAGAECNKEKYPCCYYAKTKVEKLEDE